MAPTERVGAGQPLEAAHRPQSLLEVAVITLQAVVQALREAVLDARENRPNGGRIAPRPVGDNALRRYACLDDRTFEESPRRSAVAPLTKYASTTCPSWSIAR